jgi:hypothetical protein
MARKFNIELTDTFGGESNYSWVKRAELTTAKHDSRLAIVRKAKDWWGIAGMRATVNDYGDMIEIRPKGLCQVAFITFDY